MAHLKPRHVAATGGRLTFTGERLLDLEGLASPVSVAHRLASA